MPLSQASDSSTRACVLARHQDQIPLGPVPRNFFVASVTRKSLTDYGLVTRKSGVSPACYEEVGDVANKSARKLTKSRGSYEKLVPVEFGLYAARRRHRLSPTSKSQPPSRRGMINGAPTDN